jgi:biopolymer transport protein ExbB/TolQ
MNAKRMLIPAVFLASALGPLTSALGILQAQPRRVPTAPKEVAQQGAHSAAPQSEDAVPVSQASAGPSPQASPDDFTQPVVAEDINIWGMFYRCRLLNSPAELAIVLLALYLLVIIRERWMTLVSTIERSNGFEDKILPAVRAGKLEAAIQVCHKMAGSPLALVGEPAILEMKYSDNVSQLSLESVRLAAERAVLALKPRFGKHIRNLLSISIVAPMIGLASAISRACDTATYLMRGLFFRDIVGQDVSDIFSPLVFGLIVGIAAHVVYRLVLAKQQEIESRMQFLTMDLLSAYLRVAPGQRSATVSSWQSGFRFMQPETRQRRIQVRKDGL